MLSPIILPVALFLLGLSQEVVGDGHPNQSLLPEQCGFIDGERSESTYARLYEFPWMALISRIMPDGGRQFVCSGTVINERYVVTAGHCASTSPQINQVRVGDYDRQQDVDCEGQGPDLLCEDQFQEIEIEEKIVHKNYESTKYEPSNNIALLRLKAPIDFSHKNAAPICLPNSVELQQRSLVGEEAIVAGWELMYNGVTNSKLLKINVPVRKFEECANYFNMNSKVNESYICTGGVEGVCPLESGSPLMLPSAIKEDGYRYVQYGITSHGTHKCNSEQWSAYTDVSKYMDWILSNLKP